MAKWYKIAALTTVGADGSGAADSGIVGKTADNSEPIPAGFVMAVFIDFTSQHANTDVTISLIMPNAALVTLLATTNVNTDGYYVPMMASHSTAGAASASDLRYPITANGRFQTVVAQGASSQALAVWVAIEPS